MKECRFFVQIFLVLLLHYGTSHGQKVSTNRVQEHDCLLLSSKKPVQYDALLDSSFRVKTLGLNIFCLDVYSGRKKVIMHFYATQKGDYCFEQSINGVRHSRAIKNSVSVDSILSLVAKVTLANGKHYYSFCNDYSTSKSTSITDVIIRKESISSYSLDGTGLNNVYLEDRKKIFNMFKINLLMKEMLVD